MTVHRLDHIRDYEDPENGSLILRVFVTSCRRRIVEGVDYIDEEISIVDLQAEGASMDLEKSIDCVYCKEHKPNVDPGVLLTHPAEMEAEDLVSKRLYVHFKNDIRDSVFWCGTPIEASVHRFVMGGELDLPVGVTCPRCKKVLLGNIPLPKSGLFSENSVTTEEFLTAAGYPPEKKSDPVNHPSHYTSDPSGVECITITRHRTFNIGNAIKYLWRAGLKQESTMEQTDKHIEDLEKAIWYIQDEIKMLKDDRAARYE